MNDHTEDKKSTEKKRLNIQVISFICGEWVNQTMQKINEYSRRETTYHQISRDLCELTRSLHYTSSAARPFSAVFRAVLVYQTSSKENKTAKLCSKH